MAHEASVTIPTTGPIRRTHGRVRWFNELGLLALLYVGYMLARAVIGVHIDAAHARGQQILDLETLAALDVEKPLNQLMTAVPVLGLASAYVYATMHYLVTPVVLVWMAVRRHADYRQARNALLIATVIGLVGYWLLPTAPPRLLDSGWTDTMAVFSDLGWWGDAASAPRGMEALSNQYAAFPSLHVGWAVWVALCLRRHSGSPALLGWGWTYPVLMSVVVMGTANHYLLDVLAGVGCAYLGDWLSRRVRRPSRRSGWHSSQMGPTLTTRSGSVNGGL